MRSNKSLIFDYAPPMSQIRNLFHMIVRISTNHINQLFTSHLRKECSIFIGFPVLRSCKILVEFQYVIFAVYNGIMALPFNKV